MPFELCCLLIACLIPVALVLMLAAGRISTPGGLQWGLGNRETPMLFAPWLERGARAYSNAIENLPTFVGLVLLAAFLHKLGPLTAWGCGLFVAGRVGHALFLLAGIRWWRTIAWFVALVGDALVAIAIVR